MDNVKDWIDDWCNLWPDVQFNGYKLKSKPKECLNKMIKFCKENKNNYTKDTIFAATTLYLNQQEQKNWEYTKVSTYFISKVGQPSLLEAFCERVNSTETITPYNLQGLFNENDFI
jgi:hypothetical protein